MSVAPRTVAPSPQATGAVRRSRSEIRALTGLRVVAATWVVLFHFEGQLVPYVEQLPSVHAVLSAGWIGVELFFVLSGFVIARSYLDECGRRWSTAGAARFVLNRFARVWPAWMAVTVVACAWLVVCPRLGLNPNVVSGHPPLELTTLLRQVTMTQMWGESSLIDVSYVAPGWSISAEWLAYLAFPVLALAMRPLLRAHPAANLVLATAAMSPLALTAFLHGTDDIEMNWVLRIACSFTAGILGSCAVAGLEGTERGERWGRRLTTAGLVVGAVVLLWANWRSGQDLAAGGEVGKYAAVAVLCWPPLIAGLALTDGGAARFLSRDAMVYGGRISYCLYLVHWVVRDVGMAVLGRDPAAPGWGAHTPGGALVVPVLIALCFLGAAGLHHGVEEPARRRLVRLWGGRRALDTGVPAQRPPAATGPASAEEAATSRWPAPVTGALARPWPLDAPPRPRAAAPSVRPAGAPRAAEEAPAAGRRR
ncbi:Peptidoglycan/LPS O-acetylase OafA/YrhL, contains acyltransferase and SGNH-hydrolase domains [Geodermatophilus africanus]|uniref:Peptidoglycan/LPS O-acetylase OafA/YrhL, contains acyltransferase and SGNH-hydrolase domains n=1 Tax=Geodermatophilus africanus TaxID=1137993 RepID=A0A1H3IQV9_9ACTN|nr:acyltransferase [Geodermatophilus africanus]SDY30071.1 Peptidoglycan/LPS O-acetylase OafA/YrhL, contains acyltransferase and SGNH-hydrolase domains [Geodermatophilus africanus]